MRARWTLALLLLTAGLAGCVGNSTDDVDPASTTPGDVLDLEAQDTQLWEDPQTNAHPAFDFPTVSTLPADPPANAPEYWRPIEPNEFSVDDLSLELVGEDGGEASYGTGIAIFGELVIVPGRSTGNAWVFDISDPTNPEMVSEFEVSGEDAEDGGRDVDTVAFPDGRLFAAFATDSGIVPVWNLTDPADPEKVATIQPERGSHNVGFVPGTPILYNSASLGGGPGSRVPGQGQEGTAVYDLSNPSDPKLVKDFSNGYSCHDISFSIREDVDEYRAYCAGLQMTQIWNVEDPENPKVVVNVPVHHGNPDAPATSASFLRFSHLAMAGPSGDVLIVGDETGGGAAPGCDTYTTQTPRTVSGPVGNLYFYDVSDEENPELLSWLSPGSTALMTDEAQEDPTRAASSCTAHFGRLIPSAEKNLLAIAFYGRGVNVVDFTDPSKPEVVEQYNDGTDTWDVWYYQGYLVTGDITKGMEVLQLGSGG